MVKFTPLFFLALGAPLLTVHGGVYSSETSASSSLPSSGSSAYSLASDSSSKSVYGSSSNSLSGSTYKSSSGSVPGSASDAAPSGSSSVATSGSTSGSKEFAYESPSGSSSASSADCTFDTTIPTQCDGSDNWWPVSVVGKGTYCTQGLACAGVEGTNCPLPQNGLEFGSQCIVLSKESGVRGCIPKSFCGEVLPEPETFYSESGSQETTPEVQTTAPEAIPSATPSAKCDVDLQVTVSPAPTYPSDDVPTGAYETPTPTETIPMAYGGTDTTKTPDATPAPSPQGNYDTEAPSSSSGPVDSATASGSAYADDSDFDGDYSGSDYSGSDGNGDYLGSDVAGSEGSVYYSKSASASETDGFYPVEDTAAPSTDHVPVYGNARSLRQGN